LTIFNEDSEEDKVLQLRYMFSELKAYDIEHAMKKAKGDFQVALDDLLSVQYLTSTGQRPKGVDAFSKPESTSQMHKSKRKKNKYRKLVPENHEPQASHSSVSGPASKKGKLLFNVLHPSFC
jgi:hypothetical protein